MPEGCQLSPEQAKVAMNAIMDGFEKAWKCTLEEAVFASRYGLISFATICSLQGQMQGAKDVAMEAMLSLRNSLPAKSEGSWKGFWDAIFDISADLDRRIDGLMTTKVQRGTHMGTD